MRFDRHGRSGRRLLARGDPEGLPGEVKAARLILPLTLLTRVEGATDLS